jgi:transposase
VKSGIVGLDVGSDQVSICVLAPDGSEPVPRWDMANSQAGAETLIARLVELAGQQGIEQWRMGLEATGLYWWPLAYALTTAPALTPYHLQLYALNPAQVKAFRQHYGALPKTDRQDAFLIADSVRFGRSLPSAFQLDLRYAPLQRLTRFRVHLTEAVAREKNYFLTMLFLPFSGFGQAHALGDPFGPTGIALLEEFTTAQIAEMELDDLGAYLQEKGRGHFRDPQAPATALQRAAKDSYRLPSALADPVRLVLGNTRATIQTLQRHVSELDRLIARDLAGIPQTVSSVPGLGPVWTAGLLAEIGDIQRFPDQAALAQFAGLTWTVRESGHFQAEDTPLTKMGNPYLRYYLVEAANSVRLHCPEYTAYYRAKYAQTPKHAHKRALVLTARKLVRLIDALLRTDSVYRPPEHRKTRKEAPTPSMQRPARHQQTRSVPAVS